MKVKVFFLIFILCSAVLPSLKAQDFSYQQYRDHKERYAQPLSELLTQAEKDLGIKIERGRGVEAFLEEKVPMAPWKFWNDPQLRLAYILAPLDLSFEKIDDTTYRVFEPWYYVRPEAEGAAHLQRLLKQCPDRDSWEARKAQLNATISDALSLHPLLENTKILSVNLSEKRVYDGYTVQNVSLEILPGYYLCGNLYLPAEENVTEAGKKNGRPLVLCPHGHGDAGRTGADQQKRAASLARMGAVCMSYSMFAWLNAETPLQRECHRDPVSGTMQTLQTVRVIDFLTSLPDVDVTKIGITGASGGGTQTFLGTALDPRITVSVPVVMVSSFFCGGCPCESGNPFHIAAGGTCNAEIAAMAAPRPMLVVAVTQDWTKNVPEVEFPYLQHIYGYYSAEKNVEYAYLDEPHNYGENKRAAMYPFLAKHLGLNLAALDETRVTVEEPEVMLAFGPNAENYPKTAVQTLDELKFVLKKAGTL